MMGKIIKTWTAAAFLLILPSAPLVLGQEELQGPDSKFMTGGAGIDERKAMQEAAQHGYDLKLVFLTSEGKYLSSVFVKIADQKGRPVITAKSDGPWFYADLPRGGYRITASHKGVQKSHQVTLGGGLEQVVFRWK